MPLRHTRVRQTTDNYIVIHYDAGISIAGTLKWLRRKRLSYHYIIHQNGTIYKLVDPKYVANHAGVSKWNDIDGMNNYSIGICLQNDAFTPYTDAQYNSLRWLIGVMKQRYPDITDDKIIGHEDVAWPSGRKSDPGPQFDWSRIKTIKDSHVITKNSNRIIGLDLYWSVGFVFSIFNVGELSSTMETSLRRWSSRRFWDRARVWNFNSRYDSTLVDSLLQ